MSRDWDRFKRAFGATPSQALVDGRNGKITAALALVAPEVQRLQAEGLPTAPLVTPRDDIDERRDLALQLTSRKDQYESLDTLKGEARALARDAPGIAEGPIRDLAADLVRLRGAIRELVDQAAGVVHPTLRAVFAGELTTVGDAAAAAEQQATNVARRDALEDIELDALRAAVAQAAEAHINLTLLADRNDVTAHMLDGLADDDLKVGYTEELRVLVDQVAALADEQDLATLVERVRVLTQTAALLQRRVRTTGDERRLLAAARAPIDLVIGQARAIRCDLGKEAVQAALDALLDAVQDAELLVDPEPVTAALSTPEVKRLCKELAWAIAAARALDSGVPKLLDGIAAVIAKVPDDDDRGAFELELQELRDRATPLETERDVETLRDGYARVRTDGEGLLDRAVRGAGGEAWRDALGARFGVVVTKDRDGALVDLEGTYRTLAMVPDGHTGHDRLTSVVFTGKPDHAAAYGNARITIDDFEAEGHPYTYVVDGRKEKVDGFEVCMLHEIGHAVDDKHKIMEGLMGTAQAGDWASEDHAGVLQVLTDAAVEAMGDDVSDALAAFVRVAIEGAMSGQVAVQPDDLHVGRARKRVLARYTGIAGKITDAAKPWFEDKPARLAIGARVYVQSDRHWFSYALAEREAASIRNYQWRSPAEWFADLYGICWLKKRRLAAVPDSVGVWLPE